MKALVLREHGGVENLKIESDFPDPVVGPNDVVVRVRATSLNYHDIFTRRGMPGIKISMPAIMGMEFAGEVAAVGSGVTAWSVGDRVLCEAPNRIDGGTMGETMHGGLAELCLVKDHQLFRVPDGVSFEQAAALPVAFGTAVRMMGSVGAVQAGETVLILGASGGVGVACLLLAKMAGAKVIACASSAAKLKRLTELGADVAINYSETDFMKESHRLFGKPTTRRNRPQGGGVDVVVNFTGGDTWVPSLRCLKRGGRLLICGATAGFAPTEDLRYIWSFELRIFGSNGWMREDVQQVLDLVQARKLVVPIDRVFTLDEGRQAFAALEERNVLGKVIVKP
jgi:alcohol dehydrogenase